ncbi:MAG: tRNA uridine-5-carboxymethylaminomethyl(34) synthesis GTPase MnmE [Eubacteriales bacterium]|nr:tRNA uridine-5-carboxymethylaminomethyl(34) synthesis GTPase MnmE [Eubacteriales bacterium]
MMSEEVPAQLEYSLQAAADCIAAFATPPGQSALAVLRISGEIAPQIVDRLFRPGRNFKPASKLAGYTMSYGYWHDVSGQLLDEVVIAAFRAPNSYTGENLIEVSCHGGYAARQAILDSILALGVSPADAGEFSRRAFMNGKLDLSQAEAVMDMIAAVSKTQGKLALAQRRGAIRKTIEELSEALYRALAKLEMVLEFADSEGFTAGDELDREMAEAADKMAEVLSGYRQGRVIREGFKVVIAGRSNAGKSSLLNALLGEDRAIVTNISGTTRDTLDAFFDLDGIPISLTDTAGFRDADNPVEQEGIKRAKQALDDADLILRVLNPDFSEEHLAAEFKALDELIAAGREVVLLLGKDDLSWPPELLAELERRFPDLRKQAYSKYDQDLLAAVRELIREKYESLAPAEHGDVLLSNSRQKRCLERTAELLDEARATRAAALPLEITASCLRSAIDLLAEITGENVSEELVEQIFSRFCVGK